MTNANRCVLITGASKGIGQACCIELSQQGYTTITLARNQLTQGIPNNHHYCIDLNDLDATQTLVKELLITHPIDAIICNAGRGDIGSLENFSPKQIQNSLHFNLISPLCLVRECLPILKQRKRSDIVFIGSTSALNGARYGSLYSAAKFALRGVAQSLSYETASTNCHVGIIQPGMVRTEFFNSLDFEPGPDESHALHPEDVAHAVTTLLQSPDRAVINEWIVQPRQHVVQKRKNLNT